jgi:hypothetical protein
MLVLMIVVYLVVGVVLSLISESSIEPSLVFLWPVALINVAVEKKKENKQREEEHKQWLREEADRAYKQSQKPLELEESPDEWERKHRLNGDL